MSKIPAVDAAYPFTVIEQRGPDLLVSVVLVKAHLHNLNPEEVWQELRHDIRNANLNRWAVYFERVVIDFENVLKE